MVIKKACVFDVDGVLIYADERIRRAKQLASALKKDYRDFLYKEELIQFDVPRPVGIKLLKEKARWCSIIVLTGRPKEFFDLTLKEITNLVEVRPELVLMRDSKEGSVVRAKLALIKKLIKKGYEIEEIHDDDVNFLHEVRNEYPQIKLFYHIHDRYVVLR